MMHLSRFGEIILWSSHEFSFIELDDATTQTDNASKNPDVAELVRGKTEESAGLMTLLTVMKSLPQHNKDMQRIKRRF